MENGVSGIPSPHSLKLDYFVSWFQFPNVSPRGSLFLHCLIFYVPGLQFFCNGGILFFSVPEKRSKTFCAFMGKMSEAR